MPYEIKRQGEKWCVVTVGKTKPHGCHDTRAEAGRQLRALYANANPENEGKSLHVFKDSAGDWRYFGWVSNHFRDKDRPPEIISGEAHKEYVEWVDQTGNYPELWFWHIPGSKMGKADWAEFADGFLMLSGTFDKDKGDIAERIAASKEAYTMSHGFVRLKHDAKLVITDRYRMIEASPTPPRVEANPWTRFTALEDSTMPISPHKKAKLTELFGEERVAAIEAGTLDLAKAAKDAGVDYKEIEGLESEDAPVTEPAAKTETKEIEREIDPKALAAAIVKELQLESLSEMVADLKTKTDAITALTEKVAGLEAVVKELKKSDDAKVAEKMTPPAIKALSWYKQGFVASERDETKLKDGDPGDEKLKWAQPSAHDRFINSATP